MSKLPSKILIERTESGGFVVYENLDGGLARTTLGAFTSPVGLVGWLSLNLMKPMAGPEKRASTADLDQADRFPRAVQSRRPVPPPEGGGT
ncbi:MAG: hypothetical protein ACK52I_09400 [Pseudomonadota bacterium]|jgi:hypothetical protein